jgi:sulfur-carrier protein adenylyltransferase/sulfurtransferase
MVVHTIHPELLERRVRVLVVGCGGVGSAVATGLPYLHQALVVRGHPRGLHVTLQDGERISATNCVRQPFSKSEIGLYKSVVLVNRLNIFWGLDWEAVPEHLVGDHPITQIDIIIGCVDSCAARAVIQRCATQSSTAGYWLDIGNNADSGQFILGEPLNLANPRRRTRLRSVAELYPEVIDAAPDDDSFPSCSAAEALARQEPFVNATLANHALSLLAQLFRYGKIAHHGGFVNLSTGTATPLRIDPLLWRRIQRRRSSKVLGEADNRARLPGFPLMKTMLRRGGRVARPSASG